MTGKSTQSSKQRDKMGRQENLREQLAKQKHIEHVIELANKIEEVSDYLHDQTTLEDIDVKRLKASMDGKKIVIETKMKIINKYLGDVKTVEHTGNVTKTVIDNRNILEGLLKEQGIDPDIVRPQ